MNVIASSTQAEFTPTPLATEAPTDELATATATPTLDDWSATGTALLFATASATFTPTPTADFCAWLTPTATYTPTHIFTPDAWQATGTAFYFLTNTPTPELKPSPTTPRAWCDIQLSATPTNTPRASATASNTPTNTPRFVLPTAAPGGGTVPQLPQNPLQPTNPPPQVIVQPTLAPPTAVNTRRPTKIPSMTATQTATETPTATATSTFTDTATFTPTPTETATETPTATATATFTPTSTAIPILTVYSATCVDGYPAYTVKNIGATPGQWVLWEIVNERGFIAANGYWEWELVPFALVTVGAPAWAGLPGMYQLNLYQPWDIFVPVQSAVTICAAPLPTPTLEPEATLEVVQ